MTPDKEWTRTLRIFFLNSELTPVLIVLTGSTVFIELCLKLPVKSQEMSP